MRIPIALALCMTAAGCPLGVLPGHGPGDVVVDPPLSGPTPLPGDPLTTALPSEARRLTQNEVDRTLRDVLQEPSAAGTRLLLVDTFTPYDNNYEGQQSSAALVDSLEAMSIDVATRALANPASRAIVLPCTPVAPDDADCFRQVINNVGKRMLRRPLEADEVDAYMGLLSFATEQSSFYSTNFETSVEVLLRAFLMDPEFLFRIEVGTPTGEDGVVRLSAYETATRMSYFLWGSAPDDALLADADAARLDDVAARQAVAERMLADDKAKEQVARFHAMWLGYRAIPAPPQLASLFSQETNALLNKVIFEEKSDYLGIFTRNETFVDDTLADHYGLPHPAESPNPGWVPYAADRGGILSEGAVLASFSKFTDTSPTQRGILVRSRLMCQPIDPPPPGVNVDQPPPADGNTVCKHDRYLVHQQSTSCNACHSLMDPIGFGLENYDIQGRFRAHDDGIDTCIIDGIGELPGYGAFHGPKELGQKLVDEGLVGPCFVKQLGSFEAGRPLADNEGPVADAWSTEFDANGHTLDQLLIEKIGGDQFVTKREPLGVAP